METKHAKGSTCFQSESVQFSWLIKDWRLCRQLHECKLERLLSPVFSSSDCKWQLELQFVVSASTEYACTTVLSIKACLRMLANDTGSSSVIIDGKLKIGDFVTSKISTVISAPKKETASPDSTVNGPQIYLFSSLSNSERPVASSESSNSSNKGLVNLRSISNSVLTPKGCNFETAGPNLEISVDFKVSSGTAESRLLSSEFIADDIEIQKEKLCEAISDIMVDKKQSDMSVLINGKSIKVHKNIMAARSPVFRAMIEKATSKQRPMEFEVECENVDAWNEFQRFIYTGQTTLDDAELFTYGDTLFELAKKFEIDLMVDHLSARLRSVLGPETVLDVLRMTYQHDVVPLQTEATEVLIKNLDTIRKEKRLELVSFIRQQPDVAAVLFDHHE